MLSLKFMGKVKEEGRRRNTKGRTQRKCDTGDITKMKKKMCHCGWPKKRFLTAVLDKVVKIKWRQVIFVTVFANIPVIITLFCFKKHYETGVSYCGETHVLGSGGCGGFCPKSTGKIERQKTAVSNVWVLFPTRQASLGNTNTVS